MIMISSPPLPMPTSVDVSVTTTAAATYQPCLMLHHYHHHSSSIRLAPTPSSSSSSCFRWRPAASTTKPRSLRTLVMAAHTISKERGNADSVANGTSLTGAHKSQEGRHEHNKQITHSMPPEKVEMFESLQGWAEAHVLPFLKPVEKCWQPQDFLPEPSSADFLDEVRELRARTADIPDDYLMCVIGDMITEEALPTYQTMINTLDGVRDESGASPSPWARWTRAWTAEENRHGDLLNKYLYLTGRVDMRAVEKTIQYLIGAGMDPRTENSPYLGFMYTSFQERATFISHGNTARQAKQFGDLKLAQICGTIAADERRHENAYCKIIEKLFELDPDDTMVCFEDMMRKKITMPAHLMYDGENENIFEHFSLVAQRTEVYTARDYADIVEHLVKRWGVETMVGLSSRGQEAQDYVCNLPDRFRKLEERAHAKAARMKKESVSANISWVFNRSVVV